MTELGEEHRSYYMLSTQYQKSLFFPIVNLIICRKIDDKEHEKNILSFLVIAKILMPFQCFYLFFIIKNCI